MKRTILKFMAKYLSEVGRNEMMKWGYTNSFMYLFSNGKCDREIQQLCFPIFLCILL